MNIKQAKHVHFTGIKGVGMTSVALCCLDIGIKVTGSDVAEEFVTDETLARRGLTWKIGFSKDNLDPKPDLVVFTGAHGGLNNPEVVGAKELEIPTISHAEALGQLAEGKETITVCGVGGKTTTCAMIATILDRLGIHPSFAIGVGDIPSLGTPGRYDKEGDVFICEADEFAISPGVDNRPRWSYLSPQIIVITNIEHDHPDIYPTFEQTKEAYVNFFKKLDQDSCLIVNSDNQANLETACDGSGDKSIVEYYGFNANGANIWHITDLTFSDGSTNFKMTPPWDDSKTLNFNLKVPGKYNVYNATAAFIAAKYITDKPDEDIVKGLEMFEGSKRRFEKIGELDEKLFYDDYAHHPEEIKAVLKGAREWFPNKRIIVLFQPHTYSRTKALFDEFVHAFDDADVVGIMDVFSSARETDTLGVSGQLLGEAVEKVHKDGGYAGSKEEIIEYLKKQMKPGDVFITLGAGDVYKIQQQLLRQFSQ